MKNGLVVCAALACLAAPIAVQAQQDQGNWVETRFHRIHLSNGNFVDGHLLSESDKSLVLKIAGGEMSIRKDLIDRNSKGDLWVEMVKMRSFQEAPKLALTTRPPRPAASENLTSKSTPSPTPATPETPTEAVTLTGSPAEQVEQARAILKSRNVAKKKGALEAVSKLGLDAAPMLAEEFAGLEDSLLPLAASTLQTTQAKETLGHIRPLLSHEREQVREQAALVVGTLGGGPEDIQALRGILRDPAMGVRGAAIVGLKRLSDYDSFDVIAEFLTDPDKGIRIKALVCLNELAQKGNLGDKFGAVLGRAIDQTQGEARLDLLQEASKLGSKDLGPVLSRLVSDAEPLVRSYAITGIGKINSPEYAELILERMVGEREYWPRIALAGAVQAMKLDKAIDPLIEWLGDTDANIRAAALRSLRAITRLNSLGADREAWADWREKSRQK
jgi:HEAT repeat protein